LKQYIRIGPWSTTNIADNPTQIADSELAYTENVVIDGKGGLRPRPGFQWVSRPAGMTTNVSTTILGIFYGEIYVSVQTGGGIIVHRYNTGTGTWAAGFSIGAGTNFTCGAAFAYQGEVYFVASANGALTKGGHRFNPTTFSTSAVPDLPFIATGFKFQRNAFIYKERAWIIKGSRVYFSKATDPTNWTVVSGGAGFIDIDINNDSTGITAYAILNDVMYFFKRTATYSFNYYNAPDTDGQLRRISSTQGAIEGCAVSLKNRVFIYDTTNVYEILNNQFINRSSNLNLSKYFALTPDSYVLNGYRVDSSRLHILKDYLVVGPVYLKTSGTGGAYGDSLLVPDSQSTAATLKTWYLVYDTNNDSWFFWTNINNSLAFGPSVIGEWVGNDNEDIFFTMQENIDFTYGGSGTGNLIKVDFSNLDFFYTTPSATTQLGFPDSLSSTTTQYPPYRFTTKTFDFGSKFSIKKIYRIYYNKYMKAVLPNYTAGTNYSYRIKYYLTYLFKSRIIGINIDETRESTDTKNFGLLPKSQGRLNEMALGMEFKMLTNTNLSAGNTLNFYIDGFEVQYESRNVTSKDSTL
jgi:hypothetical protein